MSITEILNTLLELPFTTNYVTEWKHEQLIAATLAETGISFVRHPFGKKDVDFLVQVADSYWVILEAKSSSRNNFPDLFNTYAAEGIYIFCSTQQELNQTTLFLGASVMSDEQRASYDNFIEDIDTIRKKYQAMPGWTEYDAGEWNYVVERRIDHTKGTDLFSEDQRDRNEQLVFDTCNAVGLLDEVPHYVRNGYNIVKLHEIDLD